MSDELLTQLDAHIAAMAPHQKERRAGRLLIEARAEIDRLRAVVNRLAGAMIAAERDRIQGAAGGEQ